MEFLKGLKQKTPTEPQALQFHLHKQLRARDPARSVSVLHASALVDSELEFCPRSYALMGLLKKQPKDGWLDTSTAVTYKIGRFLENEVIERLADRNMIVGDWECLGCKQLHAWKERPSLCGICGCRLFRHRERRFQSKISGISGGIDALVRFPGAEQLVVTEIKSIDKDKFKELAAPLQQHRVRTNLYLRLVSESGCSEASLINTQSARIIYISKGGYGVKSQKIMTWGFGESYSPFKEFVVDRDDLETQKYCDKAKAVFNFRNKTASMPAGLCPTSFCSRAKACPVIAECFSGLYPAKGDV